MQSIQNLLIVAMSNADRQARVDEYMGQDGLLHCAKCGAVREFILPAGPMKGCKVPVACFCETQAYLDGENKRRAEADFEALRALRKMSLMDSRTETSTFDKWRGDEENKRKCLRYVERFPDMLRNNQGLLMMGGTGRGKTFAAACIANALIAKRVPVVMTSFVKLVNAASMFDESAQAMMDEMRHAKLLVVDDLGAERGTDYAIERVYDVIDSRYRARLPIVITTNLGLKDMQNATDVRLQRIYDRILECCYPMAFKGENRRMEEAKERYERMSALFE